MRGMSVDDVIILTDRDEIQDILGYEITDDVWLDIKEQLARSKHMWQAIDETIGEITNGI